MCLRGIFSNLPSGFDNLCSLFFRCKLPFQAFTGESETVGSLKIGLHLLEILVT